jgi:hypothetical protein
MPGMLAACTPRCRAQASTLLMALQAFGIEVSGQERKKLAGLLNASTCSVSSTRLGPQSIGVPMHYNHSMLDWPLAQATMRALIALSLNP